MQESPKCVLRIWYITSPQVYGEKTLGDKYILFLTWALLVLHTTTWKTYRVPDHNLLVLKGGI